VRRAVKKINPAFQPRLSRLEFEVATSLGRQVLRGRHADSRRCSSIDALGRGDT
jgi:hypothetical protein